ncbi:MAG: L-threonylcarbamoyladenylate synthase [Saprospiraceae bacterium]
MFQLGETLSALEAGKMILYPTDTVWGLGCDASNPAAIQKILQFKERLTGAGLICMVDSVEMLETYTGEIHPRLKTLLSHHTRPLTVIYEHVQGLPQELLAADGSCAIRITEDVYCKALIGSFGKPITSTSANKKGEPFPSHFGAVSSEVIRAVDHVVRYRQREKSDAQPSIIARWTKQNEIEPIRE